MPLKADFDSSIGDVAKGPIGDTCPSALTDFTSLSRCVTAEDEVAVFAGLVAGKAGLVHVLSGRFAVLEFAEPPPAGRGVFF